MVRAEQTWQMSAPDTPVIDIGRQSKYVPLTVPQSGDLNQVLAHYTPSPGPGPTPEQFILVLGDDSMRMALKTDAGDPGDISLVLGADAFSDLVGIAARDADVNLENGCREVVLRYRVFGRPLGGEWVEYLHGPLTFECGDDEGDGDGNGNNVSPGPPGVEGPFDGNYAPAFMSTLPD